MWRFVIVVFLSTVSAKSLNPEENQTDIDSDAALLIQEFYNTIESTINHLVVSRDMHKLVRDKRQLHNFRQGLGGLGGSGGLGGGAGGLFGGGGNIFDGLTNIANLASLDNLAGGAASGLPILQGIGTANNVVKSVIGLDRMKCGSRIACEFMANRGLFNRTSAFVPPTVLPQLPENAQGALNLSHPSTFRSVLGILQLMRLHEVGIYPVVEAGLWGVAHRDNNRCRNQFTKCPSTPEAFITELNSTPGGLQSMLTNSLQTIRNTLPGADAAQDTASSLLGSAPQTAANVADFSNLGSLGNLAQQTGSGLGSLAGLGGLGGNQQFQFDPSSSGLLGGNQQFQFDTSSLSGLGSNFASGGLGSGTNNFNGVNLGSLGLNGANGFGSAGLGGLNGLNGANGFGSAGLGGLNGLSSTGLNGANGFGTAGLGGLNGLNGANGFGSAGLGGLNGLSSSGLNGLSGFGGAGLNGVSGLGGSGFNNFNGFGGASQFGSQFSGQGFQQGGLGGFKIGRRGAEEKQSGNKRKQQSKWRWIF